MTYPRLPPEVLDLIAEVVTEKKSLINLGLVSKDWRWPSKRLLWNHLSLNSGKLDHLFTLLDSDEELSRLVKILTLGSTSEGVLIEAEMVQQLMNSLIRVKELNLLSVTLLPFITVGSNLDEEVLVESNFKFRFNLPFLTSFTYTVWQQDQHSNLLQEVLINAVNLSHLHLKINALNSNFVPIRLPFDNNLRSLTLTNSSEIDILNPRNPYLPFKSLGNLQEFTYLQARNFDSSTGLIELLQSNTSTLRKLIIRQQFGIYEFEDFQDLFSNFKVLEELQLYRLLATPNNLLQILPDSLRVLHIPVNQDQLQHVKLLSSPTSVLPNLSSINLQVPTQIAELYDLDSYKYLPDQIETIMYDMIRVDVLKAILTRCKDEIIQGRVNRFKKIEILIVQKTLILDEVFKKSRSKTRSQSSAIAPYLPPEIVDLIVDQTDQESWRSLGSVSKDFRYAAVKRIWNHITVKESTVVGLLKFTNSNRELGSLVKSLLLKNCCGAKLKLVTKQQFKSLLRYFPNLCKISIYHISLTPLDNLEEIGFTLRLSLPKLKSFEYVIRKDDTELHFFREIIRQASNLVELELIIESMATHVQPIQHCGQLQSLSIINSSFVGIFSSVSPLLPFASLIGLRSLCYTGLNGDLETSRGFSDLVNLNKATLKVLDLLGHSVAFNYNSFANILPESILLQHVSIRPIMATPIDLLQRLPQTVTSINLSVTKAQLGHLKLFPRPTLKILKVDLPDVFDDGPDEWEFEEIYRVLPESVEIVSYGFVGYLALQGLYSHFKEKGTPQNLKTVTIEIVYQTGIVLVKDADYFRKKFQELGMGLKLYGWDIEDT